jgi:hypothetical protein
MEIRQPRAAELQVPTQESLLVEAEIVERPSLELAPSFSETGPPSLARSNASFGGTGG